MSLTFLKFYFLLHFLNLEEISNEDDGRIFAQPSYNYHPINDSFLFVFCIGIVSSLFPKCFKMKVEFAHLQENATFLMFWG